MAVSSQSKRYLFIPGILIISSLFILQNIRLSVTFSSKIREHRSPSTKNESKYPETEPLEGVYVKDIFRTKDNELVFFILKDYRNNFTVEAKIGNRYYPLELACYYKECNGTYFQCSYMDFHGKLTVDPGDLEGEIISMRISKYELEYDFKVLDVRNNGSYAHQLAVILQPAFYLADWQNLIQFFESWLANGATKIYVYHHSWTKQVDIVMKFYKEIMGENLEIIPWSAVPVRKIDWGKFSADANTRMFNLMAEASMNNALYRAKRDVKFLALMDLDEILFVHNDRELVPFLQQLEVENPDAAQFVFNWPQTSIEISLSVLEKPVDVNFDYLNSLKFIRNDSLIPAYFMLKKLIHVTEKAELVDIHIPFKNAINPMTQLPFVSKSLEHHEASCFHIRRIFQNAKHATLNGENILINYIKLLNKNYSNRINGTEFSDFEMEKWYIDYRTTIMLLNDCRRIPYSFHPHVIESGLSQCFNLRSCEPHLDRENFIFAANTWTNLANKFNVLGDIFPVFNKT